MKKIVLYLMLLYCFPVSATETWLSEEVLQQLQELRSDIRALHGEVSALKGEVSHLKSEMANAAKPTRGAGAGDNKVTLGNAPRLGEKSAKVAVIEFTDFECPYCGRHHRQTFSKLKDNYVETGKIQYVAMDYPLGFHKNAMSAAVAARCAGDQDNYWQMHHRLFSNQRSLGRDFYLQQAAALGLNEKQFSACLDDAQQKKQVTNDFVYGERLGVKGTPAFFIGRIEDGVMTDVRPLSGAQPYERFAQVIDGLLN